MILILTKEKHPDNTVECIVTVAAEGVVNAGTLTFPNQITWTKFLGALQRGCVGMRDCEVRLDVKNAAEGSAREEAPAAPPLIRPFNVGGFTPARKDGKDEIK